MDRTDEFVSLLMRHQPEIYAVIRSLVTNRADAEDLLQEVSRVLWQKFAQFEAGSNFLGWARQVARFEVQHYLRKQRAQRLCFSEELIASLAATDERLDEQSEAAAVLQHCLSKLKPADRQLLTQRYGQEASLGQLAREWQRPVQTLYSRLKRLRRRLFECVYRNLSAQKAV